MGYSCPVCETPQHDSEHLANHLAMTAMLHEADHEAWLDEHIDGWAELTPPALGKRVVDAAEQVDYDEAAVEQADIPEEFRGDDGGEDNAAGGGGDAAEHDHAANHDHTGGHQHDHDNVPDVGGVDESAIQGADQLDEETQEVLAEARKLTEQRRQQAAEAAEKDGETAEESNGEGDDETSDADE